jgi:hypothetical protein
MSTDHSPAKKALSKRAPGLKLKKLNVKIIACSNSDERLTQSPYRRNARFLAQRLIITAKYQLSSHFIRRKEPPECYATDAPDFGGILWTRHAQTAFRNRRAKFVNWASQTLTHEYSRYQTPHRRDHKPANCDGDRLRSASGRRKMVGFLAR